MRIFKNEKDYRKYPAISQSALGYLDQHPKYYKFKVLTKGQEKDKSFFRLGSAVDCYLTDPLEFHNQYIKATGFCPTEKMGLLCKAYHKYRNKHKLGEDDSFIMAYRDSGYKSSMKGIKEKFKSKNIQNYVKELSETEGKTLLTTEEYDTVRTIGKQLKESTHTKEFFNTEFQKENVEYLFQFPLLFRCEKRECKGLLDLLILDHNNKTAQIVDLKTTGKSNLSFSKSFIQFRYYLQAAFYTEGLKQFLKTSKLKLGKDLSKYKVLNFMFVVAETNTYNLPLIYHTTDNDLKVGEFGGEHMAYDRTFKGYRQLLQELKWHEDNNYWEMNKELYNNNLSLPLDMFKPVI
jgi:hypothetical protein